MAGHIKRRTIASNLDKVGETVLLEKIASGLTMAGLARALNISNLSLYHWIRKDPDREERFKQARAIAADQWADECLDIADASAIEALFGTLAAGLAEGQVRGVHVTYDPASNCLAQRGVT